MITIEIACRRCGKNNFPKSTMVIFYNPEDIGLWKRLHNANNNLYLCPNCGNPLEYKIL